MERFYFFPTHLMQFHRRTVAAAINLVFVVQTQLDLGRRPAGGWILDTVDYAAVIFKDIDKQKSPPVVVYPDQQRSTLYRVCKCQFWHLSRPRMCAYAGMIANFEYDVRPCRLDLCLNVLVHLLPFLTKAPPIPYVVNKRSNDFVRNLLSHN